MEAMPLKIFNLLNNGEVIGPKSAGKFARIRHEAEPRKPMTNETYPFWPVYDDKPRSGDKVTVALSSAWINYLIAIMGEEMYGIFSTPGYGFMDTGAGKLQAIGCGGNTVLVNKIAGNFAWIDYQRHEDGPQYRYSYLRYPWLNTMQVLSGSSANAPIFYINDKKRGTVWFPIVSKNNVDLAMPLSQLEFFPELPHVAVYYDGREIVIADYCFYGPNVWGLVDGNWLILEKMQVTGNGSALLDRIVYVEPWIGTVGVPVSGWRKGWKWGNVLIPR